MSNRLSRTFRGWATHTELHWRRMRDRYRARHHPFFRHLTPPAVPLSLIRGRVAIDVEAAFVYYRIPKAANSTVTWSLYRTRGGAPEASIDMAKGSAFAHPAELTPAQAEQAVRRYRHFTVVRNPFTRVASAYLDKIAGGEPQARRVARSLGCTPASLDFARFLDYLEHGGGLYRNAHWAPQTALLPLPPEALSFILYTEHLDRDLPALLHTLYPEREPIVERYRHKQGSAGRDHRHRSRAGERLLELYDGPGLQERVARLYRRDFEALGYNPEQLPGAG